MKLSLQYLRTYDRNKPNKGICEENLQRGKLVIETYRQVMNEYPQDSDNWDCYTTLKLINKCKSVDEYSKYLTIVAGKNSINSEIWGLVCACHMVISGKGTLVCSGDLFLIKNVIKILDKKN